MSKWFGEPWPSAESRAPVCEDDALRVDVPIGEECVECHRKFQPHDHGVMIPQYPPPSRPSSDRSISTA